MLLLLNICNDIWPVACSRWHNLTVLWQCHISLLKFKLYWFYICWNVSKNNLPKIILAGLREFYPSAKILEVRYGAFWKCQGSKPLLPESNGTTGVPCEINCRKPKVTWPWNLTFYECRLQEVYQLQKKAKQGTSQKKEKDSYTVSASAGSIVNGEPDDKVKLFLWFDQRVTFLVLNWAYIQYGLRIKSTL